MPAQVLIIHGWSDSSKSFQNLSSFLSTHGFGTKHIWLADYVSTDDDVRVEDVVQRMQLVVEAALANGELATPFDIIVHSTGGLVAREWLIRLKTQGNEYPVKRLIMLAPANFGSRLASMGKSMLGRVVKGWNNWFQSGQQMLNALELASGYQWDLARRDLFNMDGTGASPYGSGAIWPFVIIGTRGYTSSLREFINENGSDGTVRAPAANLNARGLTVDFSGNPVTPTVVAWPLRSDVAFPFAILPDRDHTSIHEPEDNTSAQQEVSDRLGTLILTALRCASKEEYANIARDWDNICEATSALASRGDALTQMFPTDTPTPQALHQYIQVVVSVHDDQGYPVNDFFVEFFSPEQAGSQESVVFHRDVLDDVHVNQIEPNRRCFFIDRTDLMDEYYMLISDPNKRQVAVSLSAADVGPNVRYFDSTRVGAKGYLVVHREQDDRRQVLGDACLRRNTTHLVEIVMPRRSIDKVFAIS